APMQLPPDASNVKRLDPLLPIPRNVADDNVTGEYEVPRPQPLTGGAGQVTDYSLQRSGSSRWVLAQHSPAEVWPVARQFFEDNGFRIDEERPQTGEFNTSWQRFDELSASLGQRLASTASSADSEVRVRVRMEPGVQRNTSEVYVVSVERPAGSTAEPAFPSTSAHAGADALLVDEMLASMNL
ncbi:outer membrane protein assembly factor BamC, partial [Acinetobacter nosocomialis]|uniref:outer membrane protein assembly factor BamC n=1 Tax=Acinetobacter nosocomialis TaxID=106654 RepID=UPI00125EAF8D